MAVTIDGTNGITNVNGSATTPAETGTDTDTGIYYGTNTVSLATGGTQRFTIDSSGNVGIGTSSPVGNLNVYSGSGAAVINIQTPNGGSSGTGLYFRPYQSASDAASNPAQASIVATDSNYSANLIFSTKTPGALGNALTERMRIDSNGDVMMGLTSLGTRIRLIARGSSTSSGDYTFYAENSTPTLLGFIRNDGAFNTGVATNSPYNLTTGSAANVYVDSGGTLYRSTSSLRYKSNVQDATHGLADVLKLRSVTYNAKNSGDTVFGGLIAEEVHEAGLTEFVMYDKDGQPDALHYGNMVALLVKSIQELKAEFDAYKAAHP